MQVPQLQRRTPIGLLAAAIVLPITIVLAYLSTTESLLVRLVIVAMVGAVVLVTSLGSRLLPTFQIGLLILLAGYAFLGKGFAHVGAPPLFVGEVVLVVGLLAVATTGIRLKFGAVELAIIAFAGLGLVRTVPYISVYGVDALRDAAFWGYGVFAILVASSIRSFGQVERVVSVYRRIIPFYVFWVMLAALATQALGGALPRLPGADLPLLVFKEGDMAVHLAAAGVFVLLGVGAARTRKEWLPAGIFWAAWLASAGVVMALSRGAMLSLGIGLGIAIILRPSARLVPLLGAAVLGVSVLLLVNPTIPTGESRQLSLNQVVLNAVSVVGDTGVDRNDQTKAWRLQWWGDIVDYTFGGPLLWSGKGFGVNLALDDGYGSRSGANRSPHSAHMTALARMGVPGLALWVTIQIAFAATMLKALVTAGKHQDVFWFGFFGWVVAYWAAALVNASFDVYFEGPQGAIWYWAMMGFGVAGARLYGRANEAPVAHPPVAESGPIAVRL